MCYTSDDLVRPGVGVRELRQNLSVYLDRVKDGETLEVTERGVPVAVLRPRLQAAVSIIDRMIAEGRARPAAVDHRRIAPAPAGMPRAHAHRDPPRDAPGGQAMTALAYVDASALTKLILAEPESAAVHRWYVEAERVACSAIGLIETRRAANRRSHDAARLETVLGSIVSVELDHGHRGPLGARSAGQRSGRSTRSISPPPRRSAASSTRS